MATIKVNNYEEFVAAVAQSGATVECPKNAIWNFNKETIAPIVVNCSRINGNGTIIANFYCNEDVYMSLKAAGDVSQGAADISTYDLHFINFNLHTFCDYTIEGTKSDGEKRFYGCMFSGQAKYCFRTTRFFESDARTIFYISPNTNKSCVIDVEAVDNGYLFGGYFTFHQSDGFNRCSIKLVNALIHCRNGKFADNIYEVSSKYSYAVELEDCMLTGESTSIDYISDRRCIYDIRCVNFFAKPYIKSVINTDKIANPPSDVYTATTQQLLDADYLNSIGIKTAPYDASDSKPKLTASSVYLETSLLSFAKNQNYTFTVDGNKKPLYILINFVDAQGHIRKNTGWTNYRPNRIYYINHYVDVTDYKATDISQKLTYINFQVKYTDSSAITPTDFTFTVRKECDDGWRIEKGKLTSVFYDEIPDIKPVSINKVEQHPYIIVYDMRTEQTEFKNHGLCILHPSECIETETLNGAWEVSLTHPIDSSGIWQYIVESNIVKIDEQLFIIRKIEQSFRGGVGIVKAWAEHIFYTMNEAWIFPNYEWQGSIQAVIDKMIYFNNERYALQDIKYLFSGKSDINKTLSKHVEDNGETPVEAMLGESGIIAKSGGFLYRDNFYFSINEKMEDALENSFDIRVGKNLAGINRVVDMNNFVTYFLGYLPDKVSLFGISWVWNKGNQQFFRTIKKSKVFNYDSLELTYEDQMNLLEADVTAYFNAYCKPLLSYEFDIQDLSQNPEYTEFANLPRYKVGDMGKVLDERLGVTLNLPITKTRKNHITHRVEKVWIGNSQRTFTRPSAYNIDISELGSAKETEVIGNLKDYEYNDIYDSYGNEIIIKVEE